MTNRTAACRNRGAGAVRIALALLALLIGGCAVPERPIPPGLYRGGGGIVLVDCYRMAFHVKWRPDKQVFHDFIAMSYGVERDGSLTLIGPIASSAPYEWYAAWRWDGTAIVHDSPYVNERIVYRRQAR